MNDKSFSSKIAILDEIISFQITLPCELNWSEVQNVNFRTKKIWEKTVKNYKPKIAAFLKFWTLLKWVNLWSTTGSTRKIGIHSWSICPENRLCRIREVPCKSSKGHRRRFLTWWYMHVILRELKIRTV